MVRQPFRGLAASTSGKRRAAIFPLSVALHAAAGGALLVITAVGPTDLPRVIGTRIDDFLPPPLVRAAPPQPDRPPPPRRQPERPRNSAPAIAPALVPVAIPDSPLPADIIDDDPPPLCLTNCGTSGVDGGLTNGDGGGPSGDGPAEGAGTGGSTIPVRTGGDIREPRRIHYVAPAYPEIARQGRIGAIVILDCVLDPQGKIASVNVLRGHPLFDAAAVDAVRQWRYEATRLNGVPVAVQLTVTVRFISRS